MTAGGSQRPYYGWWLVLICLLIQAVGFGTSLYLYSVLIGAIGEEFHASRFRLMVGVSGMLLLTGLMSPKIGSLLDRFSIRWILTLGAAVMGAGFVAMSFASNISLIMICYALFISLGMAILSPLSCSVLLTRWFSGYRGLALGISALGTKLGGVVFPPIMALMIAQYGWRVSAAGLGIFVMLSIPLLVWAFVYDHPEEKGLQIDGGKKDATIGREAAEAKDAHGVGAETGVSLKSIVTSRNFIIVVVFAAFLSVVYSGLLPNLSLLATDKGHDINTGAFLVSLMAMVGMVSSPVTGRMSDVLGARSSLIFICLVAALALFLYLRADSLPILIAATVLFGVFGGGVVPVWSAAIARLCDSRMYGRAFGASTAIVYSAAAFSAPAIGFVYDRTASYQTTFSILLATGLLVALLGAGIRHPTQAHGQALVTSSSSGRG